MTSTSFTRRLPEWRGGIVAVVWVIAGCTTSTTSTTSTSGTGGQPSCPVEAPGCVVEDVPTSSSSVTGQLCNVLPLCGCAPCDSCIPREPFTFGPYATCVPTIDVRIGEPCQPTTGLLGEPDTGCRPGLFCKDVCREMCRTDADCTRGSCAVRFPFMVSEGLALCSDGCDLVDPAKGCPANQACIIATTEDGAHYADCDVLHGSEEDAPCGPGVIASRSAEPASPAC